MEKIEWKEEYNLDIPEIDKQHNHLFELLNRLIEYKDLSVNSKIIVDTLTEMTNYIEYHFKEEERYMEECDFPNLEKHKKEHRKFIINTGRLNAKTMERNTTVPEELLNFLSKWLVDHILDGDIKIKEYYHSAVSSS